ncbi:ABC transporter permease [Thiospirochaeta perfilievii]|uniref:ABC transporter permease n=1 Tax=Thiospirochaeta perfilievii TaxID=252967 RepID=A0A5C1QB81_9SPIO|nr:FtsX-like permease family protein [Thiospirochaeta perfilievii]QEN04628.1 ABC transporter permease [Thiospirochaeta perfilievii]
MKLAKIAFRNIKRNKKRSILSIIATAIATFSMVFMFGYIEGMKVDMRDISFNYDSGEVLIRNRDFDDKISSLDRAVDGYKSVITLIERNYPDFLISPRLRFPSQIIKGERTFMSFGIAVDFAREVEYLDLKEKLVEGRIPIKSREVLMGVGLAEELELSLGDKFTPITMTRKGASSGITFELVGKAKFSSGAYTNKSFLAPLDDVPMILRMEGAVSEILLKNVTEDDWESKAKDINNLLEQNGLNTLEALPWTVVGLGYAMLEMADISYSIMAIFFFALSSTVIANTMLMVVFERRKEIGTITAMGMTGGEVIRLFFIEALYLGVLGATLGSLLGVILIIPLSIYGIDLSSFGSTVDFGISWMIYPQLRLKTLFLVFFYSVFVASFISFFPSRSASKVDPVEALRAE